MDYKYGYEDKLIITNIKDKGKASHLESFIGRTVDIISRITHNNQNKYKVMIGSDLNNTYYFLEDELDYLRQR